MNRTRNQRRAFSRLFSNLGRSTKLIDSVDNPSLFKSWLANLILRNIPNEVQRQILPLKHIRLQQLANAGLNCPYFKWWLKNQLDLEELRKFWFNCGKLSLRNVREERVGEETPKLPVMYDVEDWDIIAAYCTEHNRQYHTLVNQALPLNESLRAGNIIILDHERYVVSYFEGYGTPRDIDEKEESELRVFLRPFDSAVPDWAPEAVTKLVKKIQSCHKKISPIMPKTFEFSEYPYGVGQTLEPTVLWEWRSGSAHDLYNIMARLLERAGEHELVLRLPSFDRPSA